MDKKEVEYVATLARLALTSDETTRFAGQLNEIFSYIEQLNALDTSEVEPTSHVLPIANVFREDAVRPSLPVEKVVENAPERETTFFKVPNIIE
ncbi:MAG: Asp-tRNA(Asn)/Glu-tRNA(Gln) amidotransferase subunit GatC [Nitrospiria bacterium]